MTKAEQDMSDLMEEILDNKESLQTIQEDLDSLKNQLINLMVENKKLEFNTPKATAKIMNFNRSSLIKDEVIMTIDSVNEGTLQGQININDLLNTSHIFFVLVRSKE